jgi:hypothetical protein
MSVLDQLARAKDVPTFNARRASSPATGFLSSLLPEICEEPDSLYSREHLEQPIKSVTEGPEGLNGEARRSDLNSPLHKSMLAFKFDDE